MHFDLDAVAQLDFRDQFQRFGMQASGVEGKHRDRKTQASDRVRNDHVFGLQAARQGHRRESLRDLAQRAVELGHAVRRRKSGSGRVTEAW